MTPEECEQELSQQVTVRAAAGTGDFTESAFADVVTEYLEDAGAIDGFEPCAYKNRGVRVDGFFFNVEEEATLDLFVVDYRGHTARGTLTRTESELIFKRVETFFERSLVARNIDAMESSHPAYQLALSILEQADGIRKVRYVLLTDAALSDRVKQIAPRREGGREWAYRIWDINAFCKLATTGEPEEIAIDFPEMFGRPLLCLPANQGTDRVVSYLTVIPGDWLSAIYDRFGGRLLEQNVRTFLQNRGKVNKGIHRTIVEEPGMFFAFNNGISATAAEADVQMRNGVAELRSVRRLQIVNGGQTTASIYNVTKKVKDASVGAIRVQMKLSVVKEDAVDEIVPKISEYANTQNRISDADLFSSHPFHVRIEGIAARTPAPAVGGSQIQTYWFYERARGQYLNQQTYLSRSKREEFQLRHPRNQVLTKTDLAKVLNTFERKPATVSKGAQKNFADFAAYIGGRDAWQGKQQNFNPAWYRDAVAKTIVFRELEQLVQQAPWYAQGYRANIVTYAIALVIDKIVQSGRALNFDRIWQRQTMGEGLKAELLGVAEKVLTRIVAAAKEGGVSNVTEWCKRPACWDDLRSRVSVSLPPEAELITRSEARQGEREGREDQKLTNEAEAQMQAVARGGEYWKKMLIWAERSPAVAPSEMELLRLAAQLPRKVPSGPQAIRLVQIEAKALGEGFRP